MKQEINSKRSWKNVPKIISTIPNDKNKLIMYVDESGEGNKKELKRAFDSKKKCEPYVQRNDLYILNGIILSGHQSNILTNGLNNLKKSIQSKGVFNYNNKGVRPIVLRNHDMVSKNPPFNNLSDLVYTKLENVIKKTKYIQIAAGLNYYCFTQNRNATLDLSPLLMCLGALIVNYASYLNSTNKSGIIIFEEETKVHDKMKLDYIVKILKHGTKNHNKDFFAKISAVYFRKKWTEEKPGEFATTAGLELADLTLSPLRRIFHPEFILIQNKLYNYPNYMNNGISIIT